MYQAAQRYALRNSYPLLRGHLSGLGVQPGAPSTTQLVQQVGSIATSATVSALSASALAGGFTGILGLTAAQAIPIIGAAMAGLIIGIQAILNSGCGQTCIVTSQWANAASALLEQNIQAYFGNPAPRSAEQKAQALANFDAIWNKLVQLCSQPGLSTAGQNCIADRQAGACKWHQTGQPEFPGQPTYGACWNWFNSFRDPIDQDPAVVTQTTIDPQGVISQLGTTGSTSIGGGIDTGTLALIGAAALMGIALMGSN